MSEYKIEKSGKLEPSRQTIEPTSRPNPPKSTLDNILSSKSIKANPYNTGLMLNALPDCYFLNEKDWWATAGAAKASGGEAVYSIFEQRSLIGKYKDKNQIRRAFNNARHFTFGTLIKFAQDSGIDLNKLPFDNTAAFTPPKTRVKPKKQAQPITSSKTFNEVIKNYQGCDECDLFERSPLKIEWDFEKESYKDTMAVLDSLYKHDEHVFIGKNDTGNSGVKTVFEWCRIIFDTKIVPASHIIANPLTGEAVEIESNGKKKLSKRSNANVFDFRFAVLEMDERPLSEQFAFWTYAIEHRWPIAQIVYSGGKSLHGWLAVNCKGSAQWESEIKGIYKRVLVPMGFDPATATIARLSRLAGYYREEKQQFQKLLYMNPDAIGRSVA